MKQLKNRSIFVLVFVCAMAIGLVVFLGRYFIDGEKWATFTANQHVYQNGMPAFGEIVDRNGEILYDCTTQSYAEDRLTRKATVHAVGDTGGSVSTGALRRYRDQFVSYHPILGTREISRRVTLNLDVQLNRAAYKALDGRSGTVAMYNYETGELVCMVSTPAFDPADKDEIQRILEGAEGYSGAFMNRFLSSTFTPGSTFKLVTAAAALETLGQDELDEFTYTCHGSKKVQGKKVTCPSAHGKQTFGEALTNSCNGAFATLALEVGGETLQKYVEGAGLLSSYTVDGVSTAAGSFEASPAGSLELAWSGVGQSTTLINPCAELILMGCIANGGSTTVPELLKEVREDTGWYRHDPDHTTATLGWKSSTCATLRQMMRDNVKNNYGKKLDFAGLTVCAKSGTAEVGSGKPHGWFVGFVDSTSLPYAFVAVVEHGGSGASVAGAVIDEVLEAADQS